MGRPIAQRVNQPPDNVIGTRTSKTILLDVPCTPSKSECHDAGVIFHKVSLVELGDSAVQVFQLLIDVLCTQFTSCKKGAWDSIEMTAFSLTSLNFVSFYLVYLAIPLLGSHILGIVRLLSNLTHLPLENWPFYLRCYLCVKFCFI